MIGARYNKAVSCQQRHDATTEREARLTEIVEGEIVQGYDEDSDGDINRNYPGKGHKVIHAAEKHRQFRDSRP